MMWDGQFAVCQFVCVVSLLHAHGNRASL